MTDEEAREVLGDVSAYLASRASLENEMLAGHTFIDICNAIMILKQQPSEDCISREAVAEMLNEMPMKITETWMDFYRKALNSLNKLPSVTPKAESEDEE